jgi:AmiR/NasT family two-component response regulator
VKLSLAIAIADDEVDVRDFYLRILAFLGHRVVIVAATGRELLDSCRRQRPELIITDVTMPEMNGDEAVALICREAPIPVILVSALRDAVSRDEPANYHVTACLVKPIGRKDLEESIPLTMRRFDGHRQLLLEAGDSRKATADRRIFEHAAASLAAAQGIELADAYARLQSTAAESSRRLVDTALAVLDGR